MKNVRPVFREFFGQKPARPGGTSLSVHIGEYPPYIPTEYFEASLLYTSIFRIGAVPPQNRPRVF